MSFEQIEFPTIELGKEYPSEHLKFNVPRSSEQAKVLRTIIAGLWGETEFIVGSNMSIIGELGFTPVVKVRLNDGTLIWIDELMAQYYELLEAKGNNDES